MDDTALQPATVEQSEIPPEGQNRIVGLIKLSSKMKENLTSLESNLYRLSFLECKFYNLYHEFPKIPESESFFGFKSTIREYAIIQLWNFLKVRKLFVQDLKSITKLQPSKKYLQDFLVIISCVCFLARVS